MGKREPGVRVTAPVEDGEAVRRILFGWRWRLALVGLLWVAVAGVWGVWDWRTRSELDRALRLASERATDAGSAGPVVPQDRNAATYLRRIKVVQPAAYVAAEGLTDNKPTPKK